MASTRVKFNTPTGRSFCKNTKNCFFESFLSVSNQLRCCCQLISLVECMFARICGKLRHLSTVSRCVSFKGINWLLGDILAFVLVVFALATTGICVMGLNKIPAHRGAFCHIAFDRLS